MSDDVMEYQSLLAMVGGYLHEDWFDDYPEASDAVDDFVRNEPTDAPGLVEDIGRLLSTAPEDAQAEAVLDTMGLSYYVSADGFTSYGEWLYSVARRAETALSP